jgi:hypothetical protein
MGPTVGVHQLSLRGGFPMSSRAAHQPAMFLAILAMTLLATGAMAGDKNPCEDSRHSQTISIELDDDDLILTRHCGDDSRLVMVNMEAIEEMVGDALADVSDVMEELDDMQVKIHLGDDNMLSFADADTEWELDLGQIAMQVESALRAGFDDFESEFDTDEWTSSHDRHDDEVEALQEELESLRKEMKRLQRLVEKNPPQNNR